MLQYLSLGVLDRIVLVEVERNAVDTVSLVGGCGVSLSLEDVSEVTAAIRADNLDSLHAKGAVRMSRHGTGDSVEEGGPAAAGLELVVGLVERCLAAGAGVDTLGGHVLVVFASEGTLGALFAEDAELL